MLRVAAVSAPARVSVEAPEAPAGAVVVFALTLRITVPPAGSAPALLICTKPLWTVSAPVKEVALFAPRTSVPEPVFVRPLPPSVTAPMRFSTPAPALDVLPGFTTAPAPRVVVPLMPNHPVPKLPVEPLTIVSADPAPRFRLFATTPNCVPNVSSVAVLAAASVYGLLMMAAPLKLLAAVGAPFVKYRLADAIGWKLLPVSAPE